MVGGYFGSKICDILSIKVAIYIGIAFYLLACVGSIIVEEVNIFPLSCVVCSLWGYVTNYVQANEMLVCSRIYDGTTESFSVARQFHSISMIIYSVIMTVTDNSLPIPYIMIVLILLAIPGGISIRNL